MSKKDKKPLFLLAYKGSFVLVHFQNRCIEKTFNTFGKITEKQLNILGSCHIVAKAPVAALDQNTAHALFTVNYGNASAAYAVRGFGGGYEAFVQR